MKSFLCWIILIILLACPLSVSAKVDPILIDEPNENVFDCKNDIFIELLETPKISSSTAGRKAADNFMYFKVEILFLADDSWDALDKKSFSVKFKSEDGKEEVYPLDYMMTMLSSVNNGWNTLSDSLNFTSLVQLNLVFDVVSVEKEGWTLIFSPMERGADSPYCEVEIPLTVQ